MEILQIILENTTTEQVAEHLQNWYSEYNKSPKVKIEKFGNNCSIHFKDHSWQQRIMEIKKQDDKICCELYKFGNALFVMQGVIFPL